MPPSPTVADLDLPRLRSEMAARGWKPGRAPALLRHLYAGHFHTPAFQTLRPELEARFGHGVAQWAASLPVGPGRILTRHPCPDGTIKLLIELSTDGHTVECVLMPTDAPGGNIAAGCVSSQVGCAMGCDFCASTLGGLTRNLTAAEITTQFLYLRHEAAARSVTFRTVVFMGMGEPLLNLDAVLPAVRRIADPTCGQLGYRNVQISTVGIVPGIRTLRDANIRIQLALSLHGPDDATRSAVVPAGKKYTVADVLDAAWDYQLTVGRIANIEYCLLAGENDSPDHAVALAKALAGRAMHVNLIPHNPIGPGLSGKTYRRPDPSAVSVFLATLRELGVVAHVRKTRGDSVSAACGQLRRALPVLTN